MKIIINGNEFELTKTELADLAVEYVEKKL